MFSKRMSKKHMAGLLFLFGVVVVAGSFGQLPDVKLPRSQHEPPQVGIHQVFDRGFDKPLDSCKGWAFLSKVIFDPLPELNKPTHVLVKLKACYSSEKEIRTSVSGTFASMDCSQTTSQILTPSITKGETYEWDLVIVPRDIGVYQLVLTCAGEQFTHGFAFDESGKLAYLDRMFDQSFNPLPNHPALNDKEIVVWDGNAFFRNVFHVVPPPSVNDTSVVSYKIIALQDYPEGAKVTLHRARWWRGPIEGGDVYEGSFVLVPKTAGGHSEIISLYETTATKGRPPIRYAKFTLFYILDEDGKLKFIAGYELEDESVLERSQ